MKTEILTLCDRLAGGTLNGVYQGIIIAAVVALVLRLLGRTNAATRHGVWFITLLLLASLIPAHWLLDQLQPSGDREVAVAPRTPVQAMVNPPAQSNQRLIFSAPPDYYDAFIPDQESGPALPAQSGKPAEALVQGQGEISLNTLVWLPAVPPPGESQRESASDPPHANPLSDNLKAQVAPFVAAETPLPEKPAMLLKRFFDPISWNVASGWHLPRLAGLVLLAIWLGGASFRLTLFLWRLYQIRKLKAQASPASRVLQGLFEDLRERLGVTRRVRLGVSGVYRSPVVLGFVHPVVLLPAEVAEEKNLHQAKHILCHELAHVRRGDDWANLIQHGICAALFFHPAVWWVSKQLSLEREIACDDHALQDGRPRAYALLLADLASRMKGSSPMLAPGVSNSKSQLQQRINMILDTCRDTSPRLAKTRLGFVTTAAAVMAVLAIYSAPRLLLAQPAQPAPRPLQPQPAVVAGPTAGLALSPVPLPPRAPVAEPADGDSSNNPPAPPDVDSGPKYKTTPGAAALPPVMVVPTPPPTVPGRAGMAPPAPNPYVVAVPQLPALAGTPRPRSAPDAPAGDSSIEERLARLEHMVESLMAQRDRRNFVWRNNVPPGAPLNNFPSGALPEPKDFARLNELTQEQAEMAKRQADEAFAQAKRETEEAKRAIKQAEKDWKAQAEDMHNKAHGMQLEELKRARQGLQREMQQLDRQIQRLEQERGRMEHNHGLLEQDKLKDGEQSLSPDRQQLLGETREEPSSSEDTLTEEPAKP